MNKKQDSFAGVFKLKSKKELLDILEELWMAMEEPDQLDLLQRYSSDASDAASTFLASRAQKLISEVDSFCNRCLDGYYLDYPVEDDWADIIDRYFKLALEYCTTHNF